MNEQEIINQVEDVTDSAIETAVPAVLETVQKFRTNKLLVAAVGVVSAAAGAGIGYVVATKVLEQKYADIADQEIEEAKRFYAAINKTDYPTPGDMVKDLIPEDEQVDEDPNAEKLAKLEKEGQEAYLKYQGKYKSKGEVTVEGDTIKVASSETIETEDGEEEIVTEVTQHNILVDGKPLDRDDDVWEREVAARSEERPYVISEEEFFQNDQDFEQWSLTYYEGDDVLCTEKDEVIEDVDAMVGEENLKKFGLESKDMHLVYVKNNKRGLDFEIARSRGKYTVEVLDLEDEAPRPATRFRGSDD
jgi:hypothetical protein